MSWSGEILYAGEQYAVKLLRVDEGDEIPWHVHGAKHESYYVLSGLLDLVWQTVDGGEVTTRVQQGGLTPMQPNIPHKLVAVGGPLVVLEPQGPDVDDIRWL